MERNGSKGHQGGREPSKATRATTLTETLRRAIVSGELRPGTRINLDRLRAVHGVSLSPLREAVVRLLPTGLVDLEDQKGYRIAPMSRADLLAVTRLRGDFEALALEYAIDHAGLEWESAVLASLHRLIRTSLEDAPDAWEEAHAAFHMSVAEGCGMPMLATCCRRLHDLTLRYERLLPPNGPDDRDLAVEHTAIARAAVDRDAPEAVRLLRAHVEATGAALARRLPSEFR